LTNRHEGKVANRNWRTAAGPLSRPFQGGTGQCQTPSDRRQVGPARPLRAEGSRVSPVVYACVLYRSATHDTRAVRDPAV